jgi:hypothetical protein
LLNHLAPGDVVTVPGLTSCRSTFDLLDCDARHAELSDPTVRLGYLDRLNRLRLVDLIRAQP